VRNFASIDENKDLVTKEYADTKALKTEAIKNITRSGTTFTATRCDDTTFTFTQQDNNSVTGVKGNSESSYRTGDVNLTAANIGAAASSHAHGNITSGGDITATAPTVASGDRLVINDDSASKITNGPAFGTSTTTYLRNDGTWATPEGGGSSFTVDVLYDSASGTTGTVTLSKTAANYNHMRIYYSVQEPAATRCSVDVYSPNGKYVDLFGTVATDSTTGIYARKTGYINGTSITKSNPQWFQRSYSSGTISGGLDDKIYILRVEAWNV
jgi:hypothetical protein